MMRTLRPIPDAQGGPPATDPPEAQPAAMIFAEVLAALEAPTVRGEGEPPVPTPNCRVLLAMGDGHTELNGVLGRDMRRLAMASLTSARPNELNRAVPLQGQRLPVGTKIVSITLDRTDRRGNTVSRRYPFRDEHVMLDLLKGQRFPFLLVIWEPRDTQALERAWKLLNRCRATLTYARPSVMWFLLHALADGHNRRRAEGSLLGVTPGEVERV